MPAYRFGDVTIHAPNRAAAVQEYNRMMGPSNQAVLADLGVQLVGGQAVPVQSYQEPTYDSGGGGGGGYVAPANLGPLDQDPGWLALMAELDRQAGIYGAEAERQKALAVAERDRLLSELARRGEIERENVAGSMEARGLLRSGETERNIARQRANELARSGSITSGTAARLSDIEGQLALQQAELDRRRAEARAEYLSRGYTA